MKRKLPDVLTQPKRMNNASNQLSYNNYWTFCLLVIQDSPGKIP